MPAVLAVLVAAGAYISFITWTAWSTCHYTVHRTDPVDAVVADDRIRFSRHQPLLAAVLQTEDESH